MALTLAPPAAASDVDRYPVRIDFGRVFLRRQRATWPVTLGFVFVAGAVLLLFRLETARTLGIHEGYTIVPAREMLASGDYLVPRFGGLPRLTKPPLAYWTVAAAATISGKLTVATARSPAVLAAILLGALIAAVAWQWYGGVAAVGAAAAQLSSVWVVTYGRRAEIDMPLVLLICLALVLVVTHCPQESPRRQSARWCGVWTCAALCWLAKWHFGPVMIFAPAVAWLLLERRWRFLCGIINPVGIGLFVTAALLWPLLVLQRVPEAAAIWQTETVGRALGDLGSRGWWYVLRYLAPYTLPWTPFAFAAWPGSLGAAVRGCPAFPTGGSWLLRWNAWRDAQVCCGDVRERFLWVWLGMTLAVVMFCRDKHPNYILPALPTFSLWTGRRMAQLADRHRRGESLMPRSVAVALTLLAIAGVGVALLVPEPLAADGSPLLLAFAVGLAGLGGSGAAWLLWWNCPRTAATVAATALLAMSLLITAGVLPSGDTRAGGFRFAAEVRRLGGTPTPLGVYGLGEDPLLFYLGAPAFRLETPQQVAAQLSRTGSVRLVAAPHIAAAVLAPLGHMQVLARYPEHPDTIDPARDYYGRLVLVEVTREAASAAAIRRPR